MSSPQIGNLAWDGMVRSANKRNGVGSIRTFEHVVANIIMGADVTPRVSNRVKKPVRRGETGRDAEEIRSSGGEITDGFFVIHEELGKKVLGFRKHRTVGRVGIYLEQGKQVVTFSITIHVRLSKSEVAHHTEAYPKRGINDPELGRQFRNRVPFIGRRARGRENVDMRVRYNPQPSLSYSGHHAMDIQGHKRERSAFCELRPQRADQAAKKRQGPIARQIKKQGDIQHHSGLREPGEW